MPRLPTGGEDREKIVISVPMSKVRGDRKIWRVLRTVADEEGPKAREGKGLVRGSSAPSAEFILQKNPPLLAKGPHHSSTLFQIQRDICDYPGG